VTRLERVREVKGGRIGQKDLGGALYRSISHHPTANLQREQQPWVWRRTVQATEVLGTKVLYRGSWGDAAKKNSLAPSPIIIDWLW